MYCLGCAERLQPSKLLSFMLYELVFLEYHSQFASYPHLIVSFSYSCKILQPYVAATLRMHSDETFSSIGASRTSLRNHSKDRQRFVDVSVLIDAFDWSNGLSNFENVAK